MAENKYPKEYFTLVQDGENLLDKALKTRQLSYFQDAMLRFGKNKYNVTASIILAVILLMSIFVPMVTPEERYATTNGSYVTLPPRVPLLNKLGILDGTSHKDSQPIDPNTLTEIASGDKVNIYDIDFDTFDPSLYTGYPTEAINESMREDFIFQDTLELDFIEGTEISPLYVGGTNTLYVTSGKQAYSVMTNGFAMFKTDRAVTVDIEEISSGTVVVYFADQAMFAAKDYVDQATGLDYVLYELVDTVTSFDNFTELARITEAGETEIDVKSLISSYKTGRLIFRLELDEISDESEYVTFNSLTMDDTNYEYITGLADVTEIKDTVVLLGYEMAIFQQLSFDSDIDNGSYSRMAAHIIRASYRYDDYGAVFAPQEKLMALSIYEDIIAANPGIEDAIIADSVTDNGWEFEEGWPISAVTNITEITIPGLSNTYYNYTVAVDGQTALGVESIPFFIFGTEAFGKDLFTLIFLGLRTSLLLGFASAVTNIIIGVIWGAISGYYGGQTDLLMERFTDIWGSFPSITMIAIINALMDPGFTALYVFLIYNGWIGASRTTRMQFYRYKGREYVLAARTLGSSDLRIIFKHILPNALGTIVTSVVLSIPSVIFLEVTLSYLGFGIGNGAKLKVFGIELTGTSIGVILSDSKEQIFAGNYWILIFPTIIVSLLMITFNMFGNALRDALNPQLRGNE